MPDQVPPEVVTDRFRRLMAVVEESALAGNRALVGTEVEVLVAGRGGPQGRGARPAERPGPGRPAGAFHPASVPSTGRSGRATS